MSIEERESYYKNKYKLYNILITMNPFDKHEYKMENLKYK